MPDADLVTLMRRRDGAEIQRRAEALLTELTTGGADAEAVRHPLEFICVPLTRAGATGVCLHIWPAAAPDALHVVPTVHSHSWRLLSYVVAGRVFNEHIAVRDSAVRDPAVRDPAVPNAADEPASRVYLVESLGLEDRISATPRLVRYGVERHEETTAGAFYELGAGLFHRSGHVGPSATIVLGENDPAQRNHILGPPNRAPSSERREPCPPAELADAARTVLAVR